MAGWVVKVRIRLSHLSTKKIITVIIIVVLIIIGRKKILSRITSSTAPPSPPGSGYNLTLCRILIKTDQ